MLPFLTITLHEPGTRKDLLGPRLNNTEVYVTLYLYIKYIQCNLCNPTPQFSYILWHRTKIYGPKVLLLTKTKPTSCTIRHIYVVPWCVRLHMFHCIYCHNITEILLKVALNTITLTSYNGHLNFRMGNNNRVGSYKVRGNRWGGVLSRFFIVTIDLYMNQ